LKNGSANCVVVVHPEITSGHNNFALRDHHFIFGDACTAVVLERAADAVAVEQWRVLGLKLSTSFSNAIRNDFGFLNPSEDEPRDPFELVFRQQGQRVFKDVVPMVSDMIVDHAGDLGIEATKLKRLWLHQANINMNDMIGRKVLVRDPSPEENVIILDEFANTSSAVGSVACAIRVTAGGTLVLDFGVEFAGWVEFDSADLAPADAKFLEIRKETGTIPSLPLITGSVLSKKLAEGSEGLVIDVKWGNGSFIKDLEQAKQLARAMTRVGRSLKRRCVALVTDMNQPLGDTVGTSLELKEAIKLLKGEGPEDMKELVLKLGMEIVRLAGVAGSTLSAKQTVERHLTDGTALEKLKELVKAQGGDPSYIDDPEKFPKAKYIRKLPAPKRGYVHTINAAMIARGVHLLGAGKEKTGDKIDYAVGVSEIKKVGTQVKQGEPLMMIHYNDEAKLEQALNYFKDAYRLAPKRPTPPPLVVERVA
jgi:hypothetical protein